MNDDIFTRLREDHDKHRTLIRIIERTSGDSRGRNELFPKLAADVRAHAHAEELVFYAELIADPQSRDLAGHSIKEHHELESIVEELIAKDYSNTGWLTRFKTLADMLRHHMLEEEKQIFPVAGRVLSNIRKQEMAAEFDAAKLVEVRKVS